MFPPAAFTEYKSLMLRMSAAAKLLIQQLRGLRAFAQCTALDSDVRSLDGQYRTIPDDDVQRRALLTLL